MTRKRRTFETGQSILRGLHQAVAWARGEATAGRMVYIPAAVDVKSIRVKLGLSQGEFADRYGFSHRTVQEWEQGRSQPESAVRAYLMVIKRDPRAVERALRRTA